MPPFVNTENSDIHSDDIQDIIAKVPSRLVRWGITAILAILLLILGLAEFIKYPDIIEEQLEINSTNSAKPVKTKIAGRLVKLFVQENQMVSAGQTLGYIESTANHEKVLNLLLDLQRLHSLLMSDSVLNIQLFSQENIIELGELQSAYQTFFGEYLSYISSIESGFLLKKKSFLMRDLAYLKNHQSVLIEEQAVEQRDLAIAEQEYGMHRKLADEKVESQAELGQEESKFLSKKTPLLQTKAQVTTETNNYNAKEKEITELDNEILNEKGKFLQALNSLIASIEQWRMEYVLVASQSGKLTYAGVLQVNQLLLANQETFYINPGNDQFFGEMTISQNNIGKVKEGQIVLIKVNGYPFEEYGMLRGHIKYISDIPFKGSAFMATVNFEMANGSEPDKRIRLKQGMTAEGNIITQEGTIFQRIFRGLFSATLSH